MNTIEDRLRAAARAAADTVPSDGAPPLRLPAEPARRPGDPGRRHRGSWPRVLAPLAAATSVVVIVIASLAISSGTPNRHPGSLSAASGSAARQHRPHAQTAASAAALASIPPYYVSVYPAEMGTAPSRPAVIRATATGKVVATVSPPRPYNTFGWVTAAADDQTFVLTAQQWALGSSPSDEKLNQAAPTKFFLLRFNPATRAARLTALQIPADPGTDWVDGIALSPDGTKLAVAVNSLAA